jgi:hypothetical protein
MVFVRLRLILIKEHLSKERYLTKGVRLKKHEYRCNRCLIIENRLLSEGIKPLCSVACSKCGGLAIRLPVSESIDKLFEEIGQTPIDQINFNHFQPV